MGRFPVLRAGPFALALPERFKYFEYLALAMEAELTKETARHAKRAAKDARKATRAAKKN